jgi:hypothetical protein
MYRVKVTVQKDDETPKVVEYSTGNEEPTVIVLEGQNDDMRAALTEDYEDWRAMFNDDYVVI